MVSGWFLVLAFAAGAILGVAGTVWGLRGQSASARADGPASPATAGRPRPETSEPVQPTLGIDVEGALRDLEERYRGRTADDAEDAGRGKQKRRR